jgi:mono/diheme cytochrome c family protein
MRQALLVTAIVFLLVFAALAKDQSSAAQAPFPSEWVPSGEVMYKQFCAACHGARARGNGPAASILRARPPDLTTLAKRHGGKFPYEYVSSILRFGPGSSAHGSSDMPTWGPIFQAIDRKSDPAVEDRIRNLVDYLASLQRK